MTDRITFKCASGDESTLEVIRAPDAEGGFIFRARDPDVATIAVVNVLLPEDIAKLREFLFGAL